MTTIRCEACDRDMEPHASDEGVHRCRRCGTNKIETADGSIVTLPGVSGPEVLAAFDRDERGESTPQEELDEAHARRWAQATNDPNGNY